MYTQYDIDLDKLESLKKQKKEDIKSKLELSDNVVNFWLDESLLTNNKYPYIKEAFFRAAILPPDSNNRVKCTALLLFHFVKAVLLLRCRGNLCVS